MENGMHDRINTLQVQIRQAVEGLKVDVSVSRSPDQDYLDVRAYHNDDATFDFECTWTLEGSRWGQPAVLPAFKDGSYGDVETEVTVPEAAQTFFDDVGRRIGGYGRLGPSELALLGVLTDADFDFNDITGQKLREAVQVLHRELAFRTPERLVETLHDSARLKEFKAAAATL
jgi:hypothetical protein